MVLAFLCDFHLWVKRKHIQSTDIKTFLKIFQEKEIKKRKMMIKNADVYVHSWKYMKNIFAELKQIFFFRFYKNVSKMNCTVWIQTFFYFYKYIYFS